MVLLKEFFQKVDFEKKSADDKKALTISQGWGGGGGGGGQSLQNETKQEKLTC